MVSPSAVFRLESLGYIRLPQEQNKRPVSKASFLRGLRKDFDFMTDEERQEYNNSFDDYIKACMYWNNGALEPLTAEEYNKYTTMMNDNVVRC